MQKTKLDKEEQEILDSFERGEWRPVANRSREIARHVRYARNTLAKDKRVNIRISSKDLEEIQALAVEDGLPYQTLMASVLHRYVSGQFATITRRTTNPYSTPYSRGSASHALQKKHNLSVDQGIMEGEACRAAWAGRIMLVHRGRNVLRRGFGCLLTSWTSIGNIRGKHPNS